MEIFHADTYLTHIIRQILRHLLRQCRNQHLMMVFDFLIDLTDQIIDLSLHRTHHDLRIEQSGRTDNLFCPKQLVFVLIYIRCCRYEQHLIDLALKFLKIKRPVVFRRRQTESVVHQR